MSYYANSEERAGLIAGLRDLAKFLDKNPGRSAPQPATPTALANRVQHPLNVNLREGDRQP